MHKGMACANFVQEIPESELRSVLAKYVNECKELEKKLKTVEQERDDANEPSPLDGLY